MLVVGRRGTHGQGARCRRGWRCSASLEDVHRLSIVKQDQAFHAGDDGDILVDEAGLRRFAFLTSRYVDDRTDTAKFRALRVLYGDFESWRRRSAERGGLGFVRRDGDREKTLGIRQSWETRREG